MLYCLLLVNYLDGQIHLLQTIEVPKGNVNCL